ncbi:uncharacterized protein B0T15DRAFT_577582 [Chaetomium strumarium]|uniref:non-specific serine/threonine protein kinase n=1 Tax=Chaetomium strumarium TaxID=1170767 RepID=A0AAJ0GMJ9_9PEZI|nr:hypothetical protein B0T15DRAFT_577582 [Chaetomium strumarium]
MDSKWLGGWRKQPVCHRTRLFRFLLIGSGLNAFRASFNTVCAERGIPSTLDALGQLDLEDIDKVLKSELGPLYVGIPRFLETYFGGIAGLDVTSKAIFKKCTEGSNPLFNEGDGHWPSLTSRFRVLQQSANWTLALDDPEAGKDSRCHWSQILIPGELKSNPSADNPSKSWLDLGRYAREVFTAQDARRFVLGFTICGSLMRIWEFDRLGGIASEKFNINKDGLQFLSTVLGFLWMNEEQLGFDPTITTEGGQRLITVKRNGQTERLVIDKLMKRAPCIAGRATTCWKAHRENDLRIEFVIKDSWQYTEREEEGELLREATDKGVVNVARYYHHETVFVRDKVDEIRSNVRGGLNITEATNYRPGQLELSPGITAVDALRKGHNSTASRKRSSSQTGTSLPPSKRPYSASPTKADRGALPNRVHRRVILHDYGKPIYKARSRSALLTALEGCIEGHKSLRNAGILHRDISINNLMINEDYGNHYWPSFLIDLDFAIKEQREHASGARGRTGTRAFMAIGALLGEQHSFMHDIESFFWVLYWICIYCNGPEESRVVPEFDQWNYISTDLLATEKRGQVSHEGDFIRAAEKNFTPYYQPMVPWVNRLRKAVFPNGGRLEREDDGLYARVKGILEEARKDPRMSEEG